MLAGLRHGRTLGTPLALVVRNRDHKNWTWGMSPWPPEGEPTGKGTKPVTLPRPGHADLAGALKYGLDDTRDALERASARHTAVIVAAGAVAKALLAAIEIEVAGAVHDEEDLQRRIDEARARARHGRRRRRGARARRAARARLVRDAGGAARRAARRGADGHPGREGRRDRRRLRARRASRLAGARRDRRRATSARRTAPAASRPASRTARRSSSARR